MIETAKDRKTIFETMGVGDKVLVQYGGYGSHDVIMTIDRLTKTQFVVGGSKFNRQTGKQVGDSGWRSTWLRWADELTIARVEKEQRKRVLVHHLTITKWKDFTNEQLEAIRKAVKGAINVKRNDYKDRTAYAHS